MRIVLFLLTIASVGCEKTEMKTGTKTEPRPKELQKNLIEYAKESAEDADYERAHAAYMIATYYDTSPEISVGLKKMEKLATRPLSAAQKKLVEEVLKEYRSEVEQPWPNSNHSRTNDELAILRDPELLTDLRFKKIALNNGEIVGLFLRHRSMSAQSLKKRYGTPDSEDIHVLTYGRIRFVTEGSTWISGIFFRLTRPDGPADKKSAP